MTRTWLIDGTAFNSLSWRSFVHASMKDMRMFFRDLNAEMTDDGNVKVCGIRENPDGKLERGDTVFLGGEEHALYETNRGALVGATLSADGFDDMVLSTFELAEPERYARFDGLYAEAMRGNGGSLYDSWTMIPDTAKLVYTLHLWERTVKKKLRPEMWAAALHLAWPHGKVGSMLFRANLGEAEVVKMFRTATPYPLMPEEDLEVLRSMPKEFVVWRGASSASRYRERGFSWTLDRDRAEWFALANAFEGEPLVLEARIRRESVLLYSPFEQEVVVNPQASRNLVSQKQLDTADRFERLDFLRDVLAKKDEREIGEANSNRAPEQASGKLTCVV